MAEVAKRVPGAQLLVQLDEPALAAVANGEVPTASGLSRLPAADAAVMSDRLETVLTATGRYSVIHCCASPVPFGIIWSARPNAVAFDLSLLRREEADCVAEMADAAMGMLAGALPAVPDPRAPRRGAPADGTARPAVLAAARHGAGGLRAAGGRHSVVRAGRRDARPGGRGAGALPGSGENGG